MRGPGQPVGQLPVVKSSDCFMAFLCRALDRKAAAPWPT